MSEVWTDIFKLLSRHILVQHIQPVGHWFKEICDKNVKSIHVIEHAKRFLWKLETNDAEANRQLALLAGSKCPLAGHFQMGYFPRIGGKKYRRSKAIRAALRHSLDLFQGCQLELCYLIRRKWSTMFKGNDEHELLAYLTLFERAKPSGISLNLSSKSFLVMKPNPNRVLRHPTILNCPRLELASLYRTPWTSRRLIFDWLHHKQMPVEMPTMVGNEGGDIEQMPESEVRCLTLSQEVGQDWKLIEWLLHKCVKSLQKSQGPSDRRQFVLSFSCFDRWRSPEGLLSKFVPIENQMTGEVLLIERMEDVGGPKSYRLVRSLASQVANDTGQLCARAFNDEFDHFEESVEIALGHCSQPRVEIHGADCVERRMRGRRLSDNFFYTISERSRL